MLLTSGNRTAGITGGTATATQTHNASGANSCSDQGQEICTKLDGETGQTEENKKQIYKFKKRQKSRDIHVVLWGPQTSSTETVNTRSTYI